MAVLLPSTMYHLQFTLWLRCGVARRSILSHCSLRAAELLRENKRLIDKSIREIDRERQSLTMQEKKLIDEMKKNAKNGQMVRCCIVHTGHPVAKL